MSTKNSLTNREEKKTFSQFLGGAGVKTSLMSSLGSEKAVSKFTANILSAVSTNPDLQNCDFPTVVSAGLLANSLDLSLSPSLGLAYLVPFNDRKNNRTVATFILGYRGYIQLAIRSGYYKKITALEIKEGELVHYDPLTEEIEVKLIENEAERESRQTIGYYAMFEHLNGFRKILYWSKEKMKFHADKYSAAFSLNATTGKYPKVSFEDFEAGNYDKSTAWLYSSYWYSDFDGMALKTMLRQLISKWGIMSIELQKAFEADTAEMEKQDIDFGSFETEKPDIIEGEIIEESTTVENAENSENEDIAGALFN